MSIGVASPAIYFCTTTWSAAHPFGLTSESQPVVRHPWTLESTSVERNCRTAPIFCAGVVMEVTFLWTADGRSGFCCKTASTRLHELRPRFCFHQTKRFANEGRSL